MGQRLVITGIKNHTPIFNIYYHWSAYTESALNEADQLLKYLLSPENYNDLVLSAIKYCELNGGGIGLIKELKEAQRLYPDHDFKIDGISRNNGLIAITADGMDDNTSWAEGTLDIDFDNDIIKTMFFMVMTILTKSMKNMAMKMTKNSKTAIFLFPIFR